MEELGDVHADDPRDTQECLQRRVRAAALDLLIEAPVHRGRQEHLFLGEVVIHARVPDAPADPAPFAQYPVVTAGGFIEHPSNAVTFMIISQPGDIRLFVILIVGHEPCGHLAYAAGLEVVSRNRTHVHSIV